MVPKFGTSGLRGLVTELTADLVADYVRAFVHACPTGTGLFVGRDLRASSPFLAGVVIAAARREGIDVTDCGALPTPALAMAAMAADAAAIMVTGSHIPDDRNGLKFYTPSGEITKADEVAILAGLGRAPAEAAGGLAHDTGAGARWIGRCVAAFGGGALLGCRIGIWAQSAVSRDLLAQGLRGLGAEVVELGRSERFVALDTEAVPDTLRDEIRRWVAAERLDAVVSTDGDGDRPLLAGEDGEVVPGDLLGQITAGVVGADTVVTPLSANGGAELCGRFAQVIRTRIGSPYVIAAMQEAMQPGRRVAGYEANGGFLLGFEARLAGALPALLTRDSLLPLVAVLVAARAKGGVARLVAQEPPRVTAADRIAEVDMAAAAALVARIGASEAAAGAFLADVGEGLDRMDRSDGLRLWCGSGRVLHLRPSGNAPELRAYVETESRAASAALLGRLLDAVRSKLGQAG